MQIDFTKKMAMDLGALRRKVEELTKRVQILESERGHGRTRDVLTLPKHRDKPLKESKSA